MFVEESIILLNKFRDFATNRANKKSDNNSSTTSNTHNNNNNNRKKEEEEESSSNPMNGEYIDVQVEFQKFTFDSIGRFVLGIRFETQSKGESSFEQVIPANHI